MVNDHRQTAPTMTAMQRVNLMLRTMMETGVVVALIYWGVHTGDSTAAKMLLAGGAPALGFGIWGAVDFHRFRLAEPLRLIEELVISGLAAVAWYASGRHGLGIALAGLSVVYHAVVYASGERLLKPGHRSAPGSSEGISMAP